MLVVNYNAHYPVRGTDINALHINPRQTFSFQLDFSGMLQLLREDDLFTSTLVYRVIAI